MEPTCRPLARVLSTERQIPRTARELGANCLEYELLDFASRARFARITPDMDSEPPARSEIASLRVLRAMIAVIAAWALVSALLAGARFEAGEWGWTLTDHA